MSFELAREAGKRQVAKSFGEIAHQQSPCEFLSGLLGGAMTALVKQRWHVRMVWIGHALAGPLAAYIGRLLDYLLGLKDASERGV